MAGPAPAHSHAHAHGHDVVVSPRTRRTLVAVTVAIAVVVAGWMWVIGFGSDAERDTTGLLADDVYEARVVGVTTGPCEGTTPESGVECRFVEVRLTQGPDAGATRTLSFSTDAATTPDLARGDRVVLNHVPGAEPGFDYQYADRQRRPVLLAAAVLFALAVVVLGRLRGLAALGGIAVSLVVILQFVLPAILDGHGAVPVAVLGSAAIAYVALYLAHGFSMMTTVALLGTLASLALTVVLSAIFTALGEFSGYASEEAVLLQQLAGGVDVSGLVLGGIVIGALGALDDVTVRCRFAPSRARDVPLFLAGLPIFSRAYYAERAFDATTLEPPLGSGPYKVARFEVGRFIEYERVKDWWGTNLPVMRGMYNFDIVQAYTKFLQDIQDAQGPNGEVPDTVPHVWGGNPGDPMWAAAYHFITWDMYRHTGDRQLLLKHYENLKAYTDLLIRETKESYIIKRNSYGDWLSVEDTPRDLISTGGFYRCTWLTARMAEVLGKRTDAAKYEEVCAKIADAFNGQFFHPEQNTYGNGSQFSNVWPLYLDIVPRDKRKAVVENLVRNIVEKHKGHLSTGFLGTRYLLDVLCNEGHADVAYTIVSQKDYPGWGFMIANGATTIWEWWELKTGKGMNSHNHPAFGAVSGWFYRMLAGIMPSVEHAGYECFDIKPFVPKGLNEVKAQVETVRGLVLSHWKQEPSGFELSVIIPANSQAYVWVPKRGLKNLVIREGNTLVWENGRFIPGVAGLNSADDAGEWIRFDVGSGNYSFKALAASGL
ncbi:MAG: YibE/F family protein [Armatimonadetes bacterium]|nr:YibE/F family protein [Armatimonadota bacterium]